jgi:hypothetical protein
MLSVQYASDPNTKIVEEMGIWSGSVRIDVAVINGELSGYELKSDRDTLERLPLQADLYSRVFDRLALVVGRRHAKKGRDHIPKWWGIVVAEQTEVHGILLTLEREAQRNPTPDPYLVAKLLWKQEALGVLDQYGLAKGWRARDVNEIHRRLVTELDFPMLSAEVRKVLKERDGWLKQSTVITT